MKKQLLVLSVVANFAFGAVWSSSVIDGINQAFAEYNQVVTSENKTVISNYNKMSNTVIDKIVKNDELKRELLTNHRELLKEETLESSSVNNELNRLKKLVNNEATQGGEKK
ncbi:hypothetical protein KDE13_09120 [Campylobacter sp. faydin G-140]|uniref:hypothetical protein n=1 Tax=Campylobacter anatolicus TaxID=2829105 RepID=UPI001BA2CB0E|nr:hypothetical protein [Campylobacter anatolicus]MBR8466494.1 hypothetical protein [Campylobacter anatolicus]